MDHPWPVVLVTAILFVVGASVVGSVLIFRMSLAIALLIVFWAAREEDQLLSRNWMRWVWIAWVTLIAICTIFYFRGIPLSSILPINLQELNRPELHLITATLQFIPTVLLVITAGLLLIPLIWILSRIKFAAIGTLLGVVLFVALIAAQHVKPLGRQFMPPLDEGSIVDMPVTIPRASVTQVADDLKVRDSLIRQFPEVASVVGKAGRAETPTDPAPLDMVETVIILHSKRWWPNRHLDFAQVETISKQIAEALATRGTINAEAITEENLGTWLAALNMDIATEFDRIMREKIRREMSIIEDLTRDLIAREIVSQTSRLLVPSLAGSAADGTQELQAPLVQTLRRELGSRWDSLEATTIDIAVSRVREWLVAQRLPDQPASGELIAPLNWRKPLESLGRMAGLANVDWTEHLSVELSAKRDKMWAQEIKSLNWRINDSVPSILTDIVVRGILSDVPGKWKQNNINEEQIDAMIVELTSELGQPVSLRRKSKDELLQELDSFVRTPGWSNIWTQPIINRIDMLATGVRTPIGVKIFGKDIHQIKNVAQQVAAVLKGGNGRPGVVGAIDVTPDQIVGEGYLEIEINRQQAARYGVSVGDVQDVIETALGGRSITLTVEGRERFPVRIRYARDFRDDEESVKNLLVNASVSLPSTSLAGTSDEEDFDAERLDNSPMQIPLSEVADVRITEGPSMIKSENGLLRFYVQLNTNDDDVLGFVERAKAAVAAEVKLPPGTYIEWSGQFEHQLRSRKTLLIVTPFVLIAIFLLIHLTYHDMADTLSVLFLAVPGAVFGGLVMQWLLGFPFSVAVWVGYIACFGLAAESGLVILVYLREAVERRALAGPMTDAELKLAVLEGAIQRTRPKLMTELTTIVGLAPMLWATGTGSEIIQPMAAPVLGGLLVADEVIDLLLPTIFYRVRRRRMRRQLITD
jgi:Cu(I)/Ag(I) efflux system membrane protein CusA/SilA